MFLIINAILSHLIGTLGKEKKIGYNTSFLVSFFFSPLIGLLMVIASIEKKVDDEVVKEVVSDEVVQEEKSDLEGYEFELLGGKELTKDILTYFTILGIIIFTLYLFYQSTNN
jgi:hypothetical protein